MVSIKRRLTRLETAREPDSDGRARSGGGGAQRNQSRLKHFLDANVLIHLANDVPGADRIMARLGALPLGDALLSSITPYELRCKILDAKASARRVERLAAPVRQFPVVEFELPDAHAAADLRNRLGKFDMMLAGHARRRGYAVVSADRGFDRVPDLRTENWLR